MAGDNRRPLRLPKQQLLILAICRFAEPVAMTSVYPYIPEMIQSFNVPTDQVAKWAGLMSAVFSLSQSLTGIAWGRASDRFGRKPIILLALTCTMISSILFGFSKSLGWAYVMRSLQGLSNGNVGIIRTAVAELVPQKELQPRAFSIMPLVWTVGSIFGPALGGSLVRPVERFPGLFKNSRLFEKYPFALPNLLISILFLIGITSGFLFLRESLDSKKSRRDYGLVIGSLLTKPCRRQKSKLWRPNNEEDVPFLTDNHSEPPTPTRKKSINLPNTSIGWSQVFTRQSNINLAAYTFLAMHSVAYDQLLPIFMHHPVQSSHDRAVHLPLKFAGGFGIDSGRIGLLFMAYGVCGMIIQFAIFPPFARKYGVLNCLKACAVTFPVVYVATPFTSLLATDSTRQGVNMILMLIKGFCTIFSFPCSTILLTNSASSLKVLGTLNGVATSISAIGRALGPALTGGAFSIGVDIGYVILPWWLLACIAITGAVPIWYLIEMEGFGGGESSEDVSDTEESARVGNLEAPYSDQDPTRIEAPLHIDDSAIDEPDDVPDDLITLVRSNTRSSPSTSRRASHDLRRIPSPIGMGPGIGPSKARRYSSDLGTTRSGFGTGGTTYH